MKKKLTYEVVEREELSRQVLKLISIFRQSINKISDSKLIFSYGNKIENVAPIDVLRLCKEICLQNKFSPTISNLLLNTVYDAERRVSGSGFVSLVSFLEFFPAFAKADKFGDKNLVEELERKIIADLSQALRFSRRSSSAENFNLLHKFVRNHEVESAVNIALKAAGASGNINVDKHDHEEILVEKTSGNRFASKLDLNFLSSIQQREIRLSQPKALVVDGIIENFSEIENLVQRAHRESRQLAIFARGFNESISSSFASNFSAKIVDIIPFVVSYDEHGVNQLVDIAICLGSDVVSNIKGDLMENISWHSLPEAEEIFVNKTFLTIFNSKTINDCAKQRSKLVKDLAECSNIVNDEVREMKIKILNQRINSMTTSNTSIKMGKKFKDSQNIYFDRLCKSVEILNETARWGLLDLERTSPESKNFQVLVQELKKVGMPEISPRMLDFGVKIAIANIKSTLTVGTWLKNEAA